jgi:hypothetical protein
MLKVSTSLLLGALLIACNGAIPPAADDGALVVNGQHLLTTDRNSYVPGEIAEIRLTNLLAETVGYNLCLSTLEQLADGEWVRAPGQDDRFCTMELRLLEPAATASFPFDLPDVLESGEYRFRTTIELMDSELREEVATGAFTVTA